MRKPLLGENLTNSALLPMAGGALILTLLVLSSFWLLSRTSHNAEVIVSERLVRKAAGATLQSLLDSETGQRGFLLTGEDSYLEPYRAARDKAAQGIGALRETLKDNAKAAADLDRLEALTQQKFDELDETIALVGSGNRTAALDIVKSDKGKLVMDEARNILQGISNEAEGRVGGSLSDLGVATQRLNWTTSLGALMILGFAALAFLVVARKTEELLDAQASLKELNDELEQRVSDRTQSLTEANDEIQRFAYIVSHDLRAPLVNIMGFTSELESSTGVLKAYFADDPTAPVDRDAAAEIARTDIPESLHFIRSSSAKMDGLIGAILRLSREGRRELKRERVALSDLVDQAVASVQHQVDGAGAVVDIEKPLPSIVSDRLALEQIIGNLMDNAVKYLAADRPGRITVSSEQTGGRVKLRISDNGRGIDEKDLSRIFDLFRRAGIQDRPGDGIGLAHVRSLVRVLEGDVTVQSELGKGTTFEIDLPKKMAMSR